MASIFISDVHLDAHLPERTQCFKLFLKNHIKQGDTLYILGDFFENWVGDDDDTPFAEEMVNLLKAKIESGTTIYMMHGNHDFLQENRFSERSGCRLIPDPTMITLCGKPTLLMHGDTLCTDDKRYQQTRRWLRKNWVKRFFLSLPLSWRYKIADALHMGSDRHQASLESSVMDVNPNAVNQIMNEYQAERLIHGHTHRPAIHHIKNNQGSSRERVVMGSWYHTPVIYYCDEQVQELRTVTN